MGPNLDQVLNKWNKLKTSAQACVLSPFTFCEFLMHQARSAISKFNYTINDGRTMLTSAVVGERETYTMKRAHSPAIHLTLPRPWDGEDGLFRLKVDVMHTALGFFKPGSDSIEIMVYHPPRAGEKVCWCLTDSEYDDIFEKDTTMTLGIITTPLRGSVDLTLEGDDKIKNLRFQLVNDTIEFDKAYGEQPMNIIDRNPEVGSNSTTPSYRISAKAARKCLAEIDDRRGQSCSLTTVSQTTQIFKKKMTPVVWVQLAEVIAQQFLF
jgi:hypothetical protein